MRPRRDPDERCCVCDIRLSRAEPDHEERCIRKADGWPPAIDDDGVEAAAGATAGQQAADQEARRAA